MASVGVYIAEIQRCARDSGGKLEKGKGRTKEARYVLPAALWLALKLRGKEGDEERKVSSIGKRKLQVPAQSGTLLLAAELQPVCICPADVCLQQNLAII